MFQDDWAATTGVLNPDYNPKLMWSDGRRISSYIDLHPILDGDHKLAQFDQKGLSSEQPFFQVEELTTGSSTLSLYIKPDGYFIGQGGNTGWIDLEFGCLLGKWAQFDLAKTFSITIDPLQAIEAIGDIIPVQITLSENRYIVRAIQSAIFRAVEPFKIDIGLWCKGGDSKGQKTFMANYHCRLSVLKTPIQRSLSSSFESITGTEENQMP